jgi:5-bromo-4-chloroindolyl phosphate hydrolysis protein
MWPPVAHNRPRRGRSRVQSQGYPPKASKAEAPGDKYDLLLSELRHACLRVENAGMKAKTEKIEALTEQIFAYIRETPEKEGSISSFINYYLPTTLKLINSYADFEAQEFQGQNIIKSRERIEAAADTIIKAYERQLDNLYLLDTIDVSSDISVLKTC